MLLTNEQISDIIRTSKLFRMVYKNSMTNKIVPTEEFGPEEFEPARELEIAKLETLKLLTDALRARLVDLLRAQEQTVKQCLS